MRSVPACASLSSVRRHPARGLVATGCSTPSSTDRPPMRRAASADDRHRPLASEAPVPTAEPIPSDDLGHFTCDLPILEDATVARANITDVRIGTHDGYDRVVLEFADGLPEVSLERAEPPFTVGPLRAADRRPGRELPAPDHARRHEADPGRHEQLRRTDRVRARLSDPRRPDRGWRLRGAEHLVLRPRRGSCVRVLTLSDDGTARLVIDIEH